MRDLAEAITVVIPDQVAMRAAASFEAMPPLPTSVPEEAGHPHEVGVDGVDLFDQRRRRIETRVGGEQSVGVGEQYQVRRTHQVRHERSEPVVVPEANLLVGDGVVSFTIGTTPRGLERFECASRVQVLAAVD